MPILKNSYKKSLENGSTTRFWRWRRMILTTILSVFWILSSCDNVPNNKIILNSDEWSVKFSVKYVHSGWSSEPYTNEYNVYVIKDGEKYKCEIKNNWFFSKTKKFEFNDVDSLYDEISNAIRDDYVDNWANENKNNKIKEVKEAYLEMLEDGKTGRVVIIDCKWE